MEMNTRVQVEHTITEQITGVDIVQEQIRIASGLPLSWRQDEISMRGFAIQLRINAEDPQQDFLPSFGRVTRYYAPGGPGVRVDTAIYTGYSIPPYFDSMCLKLIVWALRWDDALDRGLRAGDMRLMGVKTTAPYTRKFWRTPPSGVGALTPALLPNIPNSPATRKKPDRRSWLAVALVAVHPALRLRGAGQKETHHGRKRSRTNYRCDPSRCTPVADCHAHAGGHAPDLRSAGRYRLLVTGMLGRRHLWACLRYVKGPWDRLKAYARRCKTRTQMLLRARTFWATGFSPMTWCGLSSLKPRAWHGCLPHL